MTCSECGYEFCALCKGKWDGYANHQCPVGTSTGMAPKSWNAGELSAEESHTLKTAEDKLKKRLQSGPQYEGVSRATGSFGV